VGQDWTETVGQDGAGINTATPKVAVAESASQAHLAYVHDVLQNALDFQLKH
jgi:hypothetical protein